LVENANSEPDQLSAEPLAGQARRKNVTILMIAVLVAGCGYVRSGKWEDDPRNWGRALKSTQPKDVVVVHSLYWRAPHWSYEAGYLFEIQPNDSLRKQLFTENNLRQLEKLELDENVRPCFGDCPKWFAPRPIENYEVWEYSDDPDSKFRVLIEKNTGKIFLGDYQV
jgi:hypothetical protein